jgi:hypothetical protein
MMVPFPNVAFRALFTGSDNQRTRYSHHCAG